MKRVNRTRRHPYFSNEDTCLVEIEHEYDNGMGGAQQDSIPVDMEQVNDNEMDDDEEAGEGDRQRAHEAEEPFRETQAEDIAVEDVLEEDDEGSDDDEGDDIQDKTGSKGEELKEKGRLKGMKVIEMNSIATRDVISVALEEMAEKNVMTSRQWDSQRKEREHHFLRHRLFLRLEKMESDGPDSGWMERDDSGTLHGDLLDEALDAFELYKKTVQNN